MQAQQNTLLTQAAEAYPVTNQQAQPKPICTQQVTEAYHVTSKEAQLPDGTHVIITWPQLTTTLNMDDYYDGAIMKEIVPGGVVFLTTSLYENFETPPHRITITYPTKSPYPRSGSPGVYHCRLFVSLQRFNNYRIIHCLTPNKRTRVSLLLIPQNDPQFNQSIENAKLQGKVQELITGEPNPFLWHDASGNWRTNAYNGNDLSKKFFVNIAIPHNIDFAKIVDGIAFNELITMLD